MNLLSLVQTFCKRSGISVPTTVYGSTDALVLQLMALLEEEGLDLSTRHNWTGLATEATHTTIAAENQGEITTIAPGYDFFKNSTLWDRTDRLQVIGPIDDQDWQTIKAVTSVGPRYQFRIRGNNLLITPAPAAGHTLAFEYQSRNWILDQDGSTTKSAFSNDLDTFRLPETLLLSGLRWRWAAEKGFAYAELFKTYEMQIKDAMGRDGGKRNLYSDQADYDAKPRIFVPQDNWAL